jgi:hypothetical protein
LFVCLWLLSPWRLKKVIRLSLVINNFLCLLLPQYANQCNILNHKLAKCLIMYEVVSKSFRTESITKQTTTINTCWEATQRIMTAKLTRLTHKIAIQLQLVAENCTICSSSLETYGYILVLWNLFKFVLLSSFSVLL